MRCGLLGQIEEETIQALGSLDQAATTGEEEGYLDVKQVVEVLTTMGHKMKKSDAFELIDVVGVAPNGKVDYISLVKTIHEMVPAEDAKKNDEEQKTPG